MGRCRPVRPGTGVEGGGEQGWSRMSEHSPGSSGVCPALPALVLLLLEAGQLLYPGLPPKPALLWSDLQPPLTLVLQWFQAPDSASALGLYFSYLPTGQAHLHYLLPDLGFLPALLWSHSGGQVPHELSNPKGFTQTRAPGIIFIRQVLMGAC